MTNITPDGPIEKDKEAEEIRQEPYPLPKDFEWCTMDMDDAAQVGFVRNSKSCLQADSVTMILVVEGSLRAADSQLRRG